MTVNKDNITDGEAQQQTTTIATANSDMASGPTKNRLALALAGGALFLMLIMILAAGYFYQQNQTTVKQLQIQQSKFNEQLSQQQSEEEQALKSIQANFSTKVENIQAQLQQTKNENKIYKSDIQALQRSLSEKNVRHPNDWVLAEVEYLVSLAGRKIWLEHDIATAIALLLAADQRVVEMNDASLSGLRAALLEDINTLEALPKRDLDGLVLTLSNLERRINKLVITSISLPDATNNEDTVLSTDINDWQENISKSWTTFVENFIVVNKRDSKIEALLSPQQSWYLRESLRNNLSKAEFSVYREQQNIYDIALNNANKLLKNYFDLTDHATNQFYNAVQELTANKIAISYPDQLKSTALLANIIQQRAKKSLASSRITEGG
ncbi:uroporphyrinogen-III C-methyltransferase [Psychromonas sp. MME2]|uniref:uroporphyrinogen-III C-methyltransferase n=1 Tax=unclassified Psychromonas TaxID=2614957 RepID=UPI00339C939F